MYIIKCYPYPPNFAEFVIHTRGICYPFCGICYPYSPLRQEKWPFQESQNKAFKKQLLKQSLKTTTEGLCCYVLFKNAPLFSAKNAEKTRAPHPKGCAKNARLFLRTSNAVEKQTTKTASYSEADALPIQPPYRHRSPG